MKRKQKSASRRRGEILPIDSYSLMGDPDGPKYWIGKISANKRRDVAVRRCLRIRGWIVYRLWEHDVGTQVALSMIAGIKKSRPTTPRSLRR